MCTQKTPTLLVGVFASEYLAEAITTTRKGCNYCFRQIDSTYPKEMFDLLHLTYGVYHPGSSSVWNHKKQY